MKYTYKVDTQGNNRCTHYLVMLFDRIIAAGDFYRGYDVLNKVPVAVKKTLEAIASTKGVHQDVTRDANSLLGPHIHVDNHKLVVEVNPLDDVAETANRLAKKIQRRFAKGESRQRVKFKQLEEAIAVRNNRTWGAA